MASTRLQRLERALLMLLAIYLVIEIVIPHRSIHQGAWTGLGVVSALVVVVGMHQWRNELIGAYFALACCAIYSQQDSHEPDKKKVWLPLACLGLLFAALAVWVYPLPMLPKLSGPYKTIGCHTGRYGGIECRIFYPSSKLQPPPSPTERMQYLHHGVHLLKGLSVFSKVPSWAFNNVRNAYLWALENAPIAKSPEPDSKGWPVVVFSHGLAGSLEMYSSINQQLASEGNIVVVLNHEDGSGSVFQSADKDGEARFQYYHTVTKAIEDNIDGAGFCFRKKQLDVRVREVTNVLNALETSQQQVRSGQRKPSYRDLNVLAAANLNDITIAGHSFGAATAFATALRLTHRFTRVVLYDLWMIPIPEEMLEQGGLDENLPVLHILSEQYVHWEPNFVRQQRCFRHPRSTVVYLKDSGHEAFSDLPLFAPVLARRMMKVGTVDLRKCLQVIGKLTSKFLRDQLDVTTATALPLVKPVPVVVGSRRS